MGRDFSEFERGTAARQERIFDVDVELLLQHAPGVERALKVLKEAQELDEALRKKEGIHPLTRRFSIYSGGSDYYPFPHYRVELQPKHTGLSAFGVEGMMLRFAVEPKEDQKMGFSGAVSVTYGLPAGVTADYILTDSGWEPYGDIEDLLIDEGGILRGVTCPQGNSEFRFEDFDSVLNDMEPTLQDNTPSA